MYKFKISPLFAAWTYAPKHVSLLPSFRTRRTWTQMSHLQDFCVAKYDQLTLYKAAPAPNTTLSF